MTHDLIIYEFGQMRVDGDHGRNGDWPRDLFRKPTSTDTDARLVLFVLVLLVGIGGNGSGGNASGSGGASTSR
ncbi:hypothetical protein HZH68_003858 [Vespula germanica]|uniref:Uncharacterized protein n=1 Tax=Vespula germanica TaxID=30212 RepID=A0A834KMT8_VESGE|nr:hypothetical protein HZH68_003858 [Vespula germanica]